MTRSRRLSFRRALPRAWAAGAVTLLGASVATVAIAETPAPEEAPADEVLVRADPAARAPRDPIAASSVVLGEELKSPGAGTANVLARVPGVEVSRTGSSSDLSTAAIRGATSAETPVYLAGVRLNDDLTGTADLSRVPLAFLDRIEVYRGNAPVSADRLGIGGAIFFEPRFPSRSELGAGAGFGSFGERMAQASGAAAGAHAATLVALRYETAENDYPYGQRGGVTLTRTNADYDATDAWALSRYDLGRGLRITALLHAYDREQGTPGLVFVPNDRARTETSRLLGALSARVPCGRNPAGTERCTLEIVQSGLSTSSVLDDPLLRQGLTRFTTTRGGRAESQARLTLTPAEWVTVGGNLTAAFEHVAVIRADLGSEEARRVAVRPAATATLRPGEHTSVLVLGAADCETTRGSGGTSGVCATLEPSLRLGVLQELGDRVTLRGNVGRYARVPTLGELHGVSSIVHGNPGLHAETGETADIGVSVRLGTSRLGATLDATGFARSAGDLVAYRQNAVGVIVPYNVGRARLVGAELGAALDALGSLRDEVSLTLLDPRDTTPDRTLANDILPYRSRLLVMDYLEVAAREGVPRTGITSVAAGLRLSHRASRYADPAGLIVIPSQTTLDVEARAGALSDELVFRLAVRNVLDARQVDTVGLPLPGRSFHVTLEARTP